MEKVVFELVKRDGRREAYHPQKLVRSLLRAGLAPRMLVETVAKIRPWPGLDTDSLRTLVEYALSLRQPSAAHRYATTRSLVARSSEQSASGWACMNPETVRRLGLRHGDAVWLCQEQTPAPFSIDSRADVERGQAWLNPREMAAMEIRDGTKLAASSVFHDGSAPTEDRPYRGGAGVTAQPPSGTAGPVLLYARASSPPSMDAD
ncbi:hypothetical protein JXD38_10650 [candidate division WOR-3 bacterium]|nr:hypothetical protein [candidate division WOR-3 bacterium]